MANSLAFPKSYSTNSKCFFSLRYLIDHAPIIDFILRYPRSARQQKTTESLIRPIIVNKFWTTRLIVLNLLGEIRISMSLRGSVIDSQKLLDLTED